jgi:hypothetical protein
LKPFLALIFELSGDLAERQHGKHSDRNKGAANKEHEDPSGYLAAKKCGVYSHDGELF